MLFFDPRLRVSKVDKQLAEYIQELYKPAIFVINKWDLMKDAMDTGRYADYMAAMFPMVEYVPMAFITASQGKNVWKLLNLAQNLHKQASARISTGDLNRIIQSAVQRNPHLYETIASERFCTPRRRQRTRQRWCCLPMAPVSSIRPISAIC